MNFVGGNVGRRPGAALWPPSNVGDDALDQDAADTAPHRPTESRQPVREDSSPLWKTIWRLHNHSFGHKPHSKFLRLHFEPFRFLTPTMLSRAER